MKTKSIYKTYTELDNSWRAGAAVSLARTGPRRFVIGEMGGKNTDFIYDVGFVQPQPSPPFSVAANLAGDTRDNVSNFAPHRDTPAVNQSVGSPEAETPLQLSSRRANRSAQRTGGSRRLFSPSSWFVKKLWPKFRALPKPARYLLGVLVLAYIVLRIARIAFAFSALDSLGQKTMPISINVSATTSGDSSLAKQTPDPGSGCRLLLNKLGPVLKPVEAYGTGELLLVHDIIIGGERQQQLSLNCGGNQHDYLVRFSKLDGTWKAKSATPLGSHSY